MEIKISTKQILVLLYILSWILFIGLSIETGCFISNAVFAITNPTIVSRLWQQVDLSSLFHFDQGYFSVITFIMGIVSAMKAFMFYLIVKIIHDKKLNLTEPFSKELRRFILNVAYLTLGIGLFSFWGINYTTWLITQGVKMPEIQHLPFGGADVWLFMSVILVVIAQIFKKGIELQQENELTI